MQKSTVEWALILSIFLSFAPFQSNAQTAGLDESVFFFAEVSESPASIKLKWLLSLQCQGFNLFKKLKSASNFSSLASNLPNTQSSWVDNDVEPGVEYEYKIIRFGGVSPWTGSTAYGYISAGIRVEPPDFRGKIILVVDTTLVTDSAMNTPLWQWKQDVAGDGWEVIQLTITLTETASQIKQKILNLNAMHQNIRSVFILGHVAVPYSGQINPDGHDDHYGAWPADGFYGELDGQWTDASVSTATAADARNRNIPGDGKFDQSTFPGWVDLEVGRVDMRNLPMYNLTEATLIKRYLAKNHKFRTLRIKVTDRPMHDDQATGLNFGATAWRNYTALCRNTNIPTNNYGNVCTGNFRSTLKQYDYLWAGSWGAGSYNSVGSNTSLAFVLDSFQTVFTSFIGSYLGDWDSPANNFLRGALGNKGPILTTCWSGRPFWYFHHMGMGESIGYCARLTMNNATLYDPGTRAQQVHIGLLGDPTLRQHPMGQVGNLQATQQSNKVHLSWSPPSDSLLGYTLFRKTLGQNQFQRMNPHPMTDTSFVDSCLTPGPTIYMVKATRLEGSKTGTYWNHSVGVMDTLTVQGAPLPTIQVLPVSGAFCKQDTLTIHSISQNAGSSASYQWFKNDTLVVGATEDSIRVFHPTDADAYKIRIVTGTSCGNPDTAFSNTDTLQINPTVTPAVFLNSDLNPEGVCAGSSIHFIAMGSGKGNEPTYTWYINQIHLPNQTDSFYTTNGLTNLDTIVVKLTSSADCAEPDSAFSPGIIAQIHPNPVAGFIVNQTLLTAQNPGSLQLQWLLNGTAISGATDSSFTILIDGNYSLAATNAFQCSDTSQAQFVSVLGTMENSEFRKFSTLPNPFHDVLLVDWEPAQQPVFVEISDLLGRKFFIRHQPELIPGEGLKIDTNHWPSGSYILQWQTKRGVTRKIISRH